MNILTLLLAALAAASGILSLIVTIRDSRKIHRTLREMKRRAGL